MTSREDVERAAAAGADAVLIGTALSAAADPGRSCPDSRGCRAVAAEVKICGLTRPEDAACRRGGRGGLSGRRFC